MTAPDNLGALTVAGAPFNFATMLPETSVQMPRSNAGVLKEKPTKTARNFWLEDTVEGKRIKHEKKGKNDKFENNRYVGGWKFGRGKKKLVNTLAELNEIDLEQTQYLKV